MEPFWAIKSLPEYLLINEQIFSPVGMSSPAEQPRVSGLFMGTIARMYWLTDWYRPWEEFVIAMHEGACEQEVP